MQAKDVRDLHAELGREKLLPTIQASIVELKTDPSWAEAIDKSVVSSSELRSLKLQPRKQLLGDWFCEGDLGFIFAFRGVGKTWLALGIDQSPSMVANLGACESD